ncbi:FecCD family ABC transporter permease [Alkalicoccus luteus]|uniref:FecCD family ABC transporter permease n=1 Tax=Alkalicoccus luteus TaxID=1237094 RepID=UPI004034C0B8
MTPRYRRALIVSILLLLFTAAGSAALGQASLPLSRMIPVLFGFGTETESFLLFDIRLPRILVTLLAGAALAVSGAVLQGLTRNDLADPGIIGINAGAGTAVAVFFLFFPISAGSFIYLLPLVAFSGALLTAACIYAAAYQKGTGLEPTSFVLIGVGFSLALSGFMIVLISGTDRMKVDFIARWLAGGVWGTDWPFVAALAPWLLLLVPLVLFGSRSLNVIGLGEQAAAGLGVALKRTQILLILCAVALAAAAVSVTGGIAFVGLMAPHIARSFSGADYRRTIPLAMIIGAFLLVLADTIGRTVPVTDGIPAGVVVALIGAPYFVYLLLRART